MLKWIAAALIVISAQAGLADVPRVVADIRPVQALVARVMAGLAAPSVLVQPGYPVKGYELKAADVAKLDHADVVFWVGDILTPDVGAHIRRHSDHLMSFELLGVNHTRLLRYRSPEMFRDNSHIGHVLVRGVNLEIDHPNPNAGQGHLSPIDPHAWLDPSNAKLWVDEIAMHLAQLDPDNASTYLANAWHAKREIDEAVTDVRRIIKPMIELPFVVYFDSYHYFEAYFDVVAVDAVHVLDRPGPSRQEEVRGILTRSDVPCAFVDPAHGDAQMRSVIRGTGTRLLYLDPLGVYLPSGPGFYPHLLRSMAEDLAACANRNF